MKYFKLFTVIISILFGYSCGTYMPHTGLQLGFWSYGSVDVTFKNKRANMFVHAIVDGNYKKANQLLGEGLDINTKGKNGVTPLLYSIMNKEYKAFKYLIEKKADVNAIYIEPYDTRYHYTAMELVVEFSSIKYLKFALEHGISANQTTYYNGRTLIFSAISIHDIEKVELLVKHGANMDKIVNFDIKPITLALNLRSFKLAYRMLELGANPFIKRDASGWKEGNSLIEKVSFSAVENIGQNWKYFNLKDDELGRIRFTHSIEEKWFKKIFYKFVELGYLDKEGNVLVEPILVKWPDENHN